MRRNIRPAVILIVLSAASIAGHAVHPFAGSAYSTSKAALSALTREMAVEFAALGVRVNAVAPGEIETEMIGAEYEPLIPRIPPPTRSAGTARSASPGPRPIPWPRPGGSPIPPAP